ncbi:Fic family protein [Saxibacter everestensis]|uniref:Fic family protein n=1 Tax=Saxibacter everestensis TaxID=2909229 RepID=A0ABY8QQF3_9MICO|nr:Fic family protein [Brevibacteriaceae bacterium ZFBP1038]
MQGRAVPDDLSGTQLAAAIRVSALAEELGSHPHPLSASPMQAIARLHVAAAAGLIDDAQVGRPRIGAELPRDLSGLPPAPAAEAAAARLRGLAELLGSDAKHSALLTAAIAHGEILAIRPFVLGNGLVARAVFRILLVSGGVDPSGVIVPEAAFLADAVGYGQAAAQYTSGADVPGWVASCARAVTDGAGEGSTIADAVLAGKLPQI